MDENNLSSLGLNFPPILVIKVMQVTVTREEEIYVPSKNLQRRKDSKRCPRCGGRLAERYGRYGPYLACEDRFCNYTRSK